MANKLWATLVLFILLCEKSGCLGASPSCSSSISISINQGGQNQPNCMSGNVSSSCQSLDYVLNNIHQVDICSSGVLRILVMYSHVIKDSGISYVNLAVLPRIAQLAVSGSLSDHLIKITCESSWGFVVNGNSDSTLTLQNISFDGCTSSNVDVANFSSSQFFVIASHFAVVEIDNCTVTRCASVQLQIVDSGVVRDSWFSYGRLNQISDRPYTSFALESDCHQLRVEDTKFVNNNPSGGLGVRNCNASLLIIKNCYFDHNLPGLQLGRDFRSMHNERCDQNLNMNGTVFTRNPRAFFVHSSSYAQISIFSTNNQFVKRGNLFSLGGAVVIASSFKLSLFMNFTNDTFVGNESPLGGMIWYDSTFQNNADISQITTRFLNCSFSENKAGDGAVLYSNIKNPYLFVSFSNCIMTNNQIILRRSTLLYSGIIHMQGGELELIDSVIAENAGTALVLDFTQVSFEGIVTFSRNVGTRGGAIHWLTTFNVTTSHNSTVNVLNNTASKGGGIYIGSIETYSVYSSNCTLDFILSNNVADSSGHSIYFEDPKFISKFNNTYWMDKFHVVLSSEPSITSSVNNLTTNTTDMLLFPGERIFVDVVASDYWKNNVTCDAQFTLLCGSVVCKRHSQPQLDGSSVYAPLLYIHALNSGPQLTSLSIRSIDVFPIMLQLVFWCEYSTNNISITVNLTECPKGFYYDSNTKDCKCLINSDSIACSVEHGVACIRQGYWFGIVSINSTSEYITTPCDPKYCSRPSSQLCPPQVAPSLGDPFFVLPRDNLDDQCEKNQGGLLCFGCRNDYEFTFQAVRCIPRTQCSPWQPAVLIFFTLLYQFTTISFIVVALRMKLKVGSGILYGPLFALVVANLLLNSCYSANVVTLQVAVTTVSSLLQLNPEFFGYIPWCFIEGLGRLGNYALRYISPLMIGLSLFFLAYIARKFPRFLSTVQRSPVQLICLLLLLTFWSLTETTFSLLIPVNVPGVPGVRVFNDPKVKYFHNEHIVLALLAIGVTVVFILPFTIILLISPFCRARFHRISPILDEFQSCYKDKFRWYSALYLIFWVAISISHQLSPITVQIELIILCVLHLILQPYSNRWLNTMDSVILTDLVLLSVVLNQTSSCNVLTSNASPRLILVYMLVLFSVSMIPFGVMFFIVRRCFLAYKHSKMPHEDPLAYYAVVEATSQVPKPSFTEVSMYDLDEFIEEREPVVSMEQMTR